MFIIGSSMAGFFGTITVILTITVIRVENSPYAYFRDESTIAICLAICFILTIIGIVLMTFGIVKRRNSAALTSIINGTKQNFCQKCGINIASTASQCPICGSIVNQHSYDKNAYAQNTYGQNVYDQNTYNQNIYQ